MLQMIITADRASAIPRAAVCCCTVLAICAAACGEAPQAGGKVFSSASPAPAATTKPAVSISPEEISELRMSRRATEAIASRSEPTSRPAGPKLPPEGAEVLGRVARLQAASKNDGAKLIFLPAKGKADELPRYIQPCELRAKMENLAAKDKTIRFRVWGRSSNFEGKSYLMPITISLVRTPTSAPAVIATTRRAASQPAASGDLLGELMRDKPEPSVTADSGAKPIKSQEASVAPDKATVLPVLRGKIIADRLVRVTSDAAGIWHAHFRGDNRLSEPPIELLPCAMLAKAQGYGGKQVTISGRVTTYNGKRYLLLWKVLSEHKLGRF